MDHRGARYLCNRRCSVVAGLLSYCCVRQAPTRATGCVRVGEVSGAVALLVSLVISSSSDQDARAARDIAVVLVAQQVTRPSRRRSKLEHPVVSTESLAARNRHWLGASSSSLAGLIPMGAAASACDNVGRSHPAPVPCDGRSPR